MSGLPVRGAAVRGEPVPALPIRAVRFGPVSVVRRPRSLVAGVVTALVAVLLLALAVGRGEFGVPLPDVLRVLTGGGDEAQRLVVLELRLPRALTGALVGLALGTAGALTQAVARNPLASPDVLGITAGASTAVVALLVLGGGGTGALAAVGTPVAALAGALAAAAAVYLLAWRDGIEGLRLALVGLGVGAAGGAATSYLLLRADLLEATQATVWITGSLNGRGWEHVVPLLVVVPVTLVLVAVAAPHVAVLQLGTDSARALGVRLQSSLALVVLLAVVLAAVATAAAGPVAFVALMAPQIALRLTGGSGPPLAVSGLTGAALVLAADVVARTVLPVELPVGVVTAAVGAPYLLFLLVRQNRRIDA